MGTDLRLAGTSWVVIGEEGLGLLQFPATSVEAQLIREAEEPDPVQGSNGRKFVAWSDDHRVNR